MTLQEAIDTLRSLDLSDIRTLLQSHECKGKQGVSVDCPISKYLQKLTVKQISVTTCIARTIPYLGSDEERSGLPESVSYFIRHFDAGDFPELIRN